MREDARDAQQRSAQLIDHVRAEARHEPEVAVKEARSTAEAEAAAARAAAAAETAATLADEQARWKDQAEQTAAGLRQAQTEGWPPR